MNTSWISGGIVVSERAGEPAQRPRTMVIGARRSTRNGDAR
ncbi:MAG TPA: hypothetical protein VGO23_00565 [Pseudonocardia sp.]|nr:hypothetical protein [Pseudonocardia sp.]HEV7468256.1 hypothetical protein [Pseudonocardia sp.]